MKFPDLRRFKARRLAPIVAIGAIIAVFGLAAPGLASLLPDTKPTLARGLAALDSFDYDAARQIFTGLAGDGNVAAESWLGHMEEEGLGTPPDGAKAAQWYQKAAASGSAEAERQLGELYLHGAAVLQDLGKARHWLQLAAAKKDKVAERELGEIYAKGLGGAVDATRAYGWLSLAAADGDTLAANLRDAVARKLPADAASRAQSVIAADLKTDKDKAESPPAVAAQQPPVVDKSASAG